MLPRRTVFLGSVGIGSIGHELPLLKRRPNTNLPGIITGLLLIGRGFSLTRSFITPLMHHILSKLIQRNNILILNDLLHQIDLFVPLESRRGRGARSYWSSTNARRDHFRDTESKNQREADASHG
jgi:hypothetical protein